MRIDGLQMKLQTEVWNSVAMTDHYKRKSCTLRIVKGGARGEEAIRLPATEVDQEHPDRNCQPAGIYRTPEVRDSAL
jgi:hypothetical protein